MSNISYPRYKLPSDLNVNSVTASNILVENDITINGTASINVVNTIESNKIVVGDKYIVLASGSNSQSDLHGAGILFGSGSNETPTGDQNSVAYLLYRNDSGDGRIDIFPGLNVSGSLGNGFQVSVSDLFAHAEGYKTLASGQYSHAEGYQSTASGDFSHAEGRDTLASSYGAHAEGQNTQAVNFNAHAEGSSTNASGQASHAEGILTLALGVASHAEGYKTTASMQYSHAEGNSTIASGAFSHTEGSGTLTSHWFAHAEGVSTLASQYGSHAEGLLTTASSQYSHAEGNRTLASGNYSHAEGDRTITYGYASHAEGYNTITSASYQHVEGMWNATSSTALMLIGNGTSSINRKNILEVYTGSVVISGSLFSTTNISASSLTGALFGTASYSQDAAKLGNVTSSLYALKTDVTGAITNFPTRAEVTGALSTYLTGVATDINITGSGTVSDPVILKNDISLSSVTASIGIKIDGILLNGDSLVATGLYSHAEGFQSKAYGDYSHAEGWNTQASGSYSHAQGLASKAFGNASHAEGVSTNAYGTRSHSEGYYTYAIGVGSHAEGINTQASGSHSHAEGTETIAEGNYSHAEGSFTLAAGPCSHVEGLNTYTDSQAGYSHAEGYMTTASVNYQHVQGIFNATSSNALMLIGNGIDDSTRSNILEVYTGSVNILGQSVLSGGQVVKVSNKTSDYSLTASSDYIIAFNGTNLTGTLPSASTCAGSTFIIKNKNASPLYITSSGGNIDGNGAITINLQYHSYTLVSDGTDWNII